QWSWMGSATHLRQGYGVASIEGEVARVATSKLGNERVSITNPAPNPGIISGRCLQCGLLAIGIGGWRTNSTGVQWWLVVATRGDADKIDIVESLALSAVERVDDIISYHD